MTQRTYSADIESAQATKIRESVRVAVLARVLSFYPDTMTVDVQPLVLEEIDGEYEEPPALVGMPVACMCAGEFSMRPWYRRGDVGIVIVGDYDADAVYLQGKPAAPNTARNHALEDGVFIGGISLAGKAPRGLPTEAIVISAGNTHLAIRPDGITLQGNLHVDGQITSTG